MIRALRWFTQFFAVFYLLTYAGAAIYILKDVESIGLLAFVTASIGMVAFSVFSIIYALSKE